MTSKQTKISDVDVEAAVPAVAPRVGSMGDCEKKHGTAPVDTGAAKRKAGKQRIDPAAFDVPVNDEAPPEPTKPSGKK